MMRSLFAGVSGLKTHQVRMDVIGNNIANVNTVAYKSSSMTFASLMSQTTQKASGANSSTGTGGINPRQIGLGVKTSAINTNITGQGASQSTGNPFDIMINGQNFFVVNNGQENYFTRDGSFYVDGAGNLAMTSTGYNVMGWQVDETTGAIKKDTVSALRVMNSANMSYPPAATTDGYMSGIIDKNDTDVTSANGRVVNFKFYDALGYSYTAKFVFKQSDDKHIYSLELDKVVDSEGEEVMVKDADGNEVPLASVAGVFGDSGRVVEKESKLTFDKSKYVLNGDTLQTTDNPPVTLAKISDIKNGTSSLKDANNNEISVEEQLDNLAKAYGMEGSSEEFLNLAINTETVATNPPVYKSIREMIQNDGNLNALGTAEVKDANNQGTGVYNIAARKFDGVTIQFDSANGKFIGINGLATQQTEKLNLGGLGEGNFSDIEIDFSTISNVDNKGTSTIGATNGKDDEFNTGSGRRVGAMIGLSVEQNGMIYASYDNGMTKLLGQIATAKFANASGLEKLADNLYSATLNSGLFDGVGVDITAEGDYMSTGQLEMSNVDLSSEFTEMITTQRGFQANSRIITVSDTLLEELTNLKR